MTLDGTLTGTKTSDQSAPRSNGYEGVLPLEISISGASPLNVV